MKRNKNNKDCELVEMLIIVFLLLKSVGLILEAIWGYGWVVDSLFSIGLLILWRKNLRE